MTPRRLASAADLALRRKAFLARVGSTHWPHDVRLAADPACLAGVDEAQLEAALKSGAVSREQYALI